MKNLTYKELLEKISKMTEEQKNMTVTVFLKMENEYYPVGDIIQCEDLLILDADHPILVV